jgi:3-oxoadipate enol-lactonase
MAQSQPATKSGYLKRPDASIFFEVTGAGPALVFAHGLGGNHLSWWQQVPHFADRFTCITFAHRGFTPSTVEHGADPANFADDLEALLDHLGLDQAVLVAQSMGGWTCLEFALRAPKRVRVLVLASTSGTIDFRQLGRDDLREWATGSEATRAALQRDSIHVAAGRRMAEEQPSLHFLYRAIDALTPGERKDSIRKRLFETRVRPPETLSNLAMPVLFLTGGEDVVFPAAAAAPLARVAPRGRAVSVPAAGHSVYFERASEFNRLVDAFLAEHTG